MKQSNNNSSSSTNIIQNIKNVFSLAYEIDTNLMNKYLLTSFIGAISPVIATFIFRFFIDNMVMYQSIKSISIPLIIVIIFSAYTFLRLMEIICYWGLNTAYYDFLLRNKLQNGLMYRFVRKLSSLDLEHLENSDIQNLLNIVEHSYLWQIPDFIRISSYLFSNIIGVIIGCILLFPYGWWIPFVILAVCLPRFYFKIKHGINYWSMYGSGAPENTKLWYLGWLLRDKTPILETRIFQSQEAILQKLQHIQNYLFALHKKPLDTYKQVLIIAPIIETLTVFGIGYSFFPTVFQGYVSVGILTFIILTLENLKTNTAWGASHFGEIYEKNLFIKPFFELQALPQLIKESENPTSFDHIKPPLIEFRNVSFSYPNGKKVLHNISFTIEPGENIALVGNNGVGKSTIIKLLCRFYDVSEGKILINNINIKDLKLSNWYSHLGTLFQDFVKYDFTVRENIMLGKPDIQDTERMIVVAKQSGAYEFIQSLPNKFDQVLGRRFEEGSELSGGQWQKLAIARAFYQQAPILIMDEPTSAIDAEAEYEIFTNLETMYDNKTLILVSHRFSTVRNANKIIVIDDGTIVEQGTHEELIQNNSKYARMFLTQAEGYK
ncbi:MAG: ABC transporter ATP-binding protein [Candidatus Roizmanbacteria bacterium]